MVLVILFQINPPSVEDCQFNIVPTFPDKVTTPEFDVEQKVVAPAVVPPNDWLKTFCSFPKGKIKIIPNKKYRIKISFFMKFRNSGVGKNNNKNNVIANTRLSRIF